MDRIIDIAAGPQAGRYRVTFDDAGEIDHIEKMAGRRSGRQGWRWVWPVRPRAGQSGRRPTPISLRIREALIPQRAKAGAAK